MRKILIVLVVLFLSSFAYAEIEEVSSLTSGYGTQSVQYKIIRDRETGTEYIVVIAKEGTAICQREHRGIEDDSSDEG